MIINKENKCVMTMSIHPDDNWMGDGWAFVPPDLEEQALRLAPYCNLIFDGEKLVGITDSGDRPPPQPEPPDGDGGVIGRLLSEVETLREQVAELAKTGALRHGGDNP